MADLPKAPADLSKRAQALWRSILTEYELSSAEVEVLRQALTSLDRADEAAVIVKRDGLVSVDRYGSPKAHPAIDIEARSRAIFARLVAQLGVRLTVDAGTGRRQHTARKAGG